MTFEEFNLVVTLLMVKSRSPELNVLGCCLGVTRTVTFIISVTLVKPVYQQLI